MKKNIQSVLLAEKSIHTSVFCNYLSHNTGMEIKHIVYDRDWLHLLEDSVRQECGDDLLFFIDLSAIPQLSYDKVFNDAGKYYCHWGTVLVNVDRNKINRDLVLQWPNCHGIFGRNISRVELTAGMKKILEGEYWLPRGVMTELIGYYRSDRDEKRKSQSPVQISLTSREEDILKLLATGISNAEMAETLFVSENTIKSHLYKMFKKIDVRNRSQARTWARQYYL